MAINVSNPYEFFTEIDGTPLETGYIWIGVANTDAETNPISIYWDAELTIPAAQPVRTIGGYPDNSGTAARLYAGENFSITVEDKNNVLVFSRASLDESEIKEGDAVYTDGSATMTGALEIDRELGGQPFIRMYLDSVERLRATTLSDSSAIGFSAFDISGAANVEGHFYYHADEAEWTIGATTYDPDNVVQTAAIFSSFNEWTNINTYNVTGDQNVIVQQENDDNKLAWYNNSTYSGFLGYDASQAASFASGLFYQHSNETWHIGNNFTLSEQIVTRGDLTPVYGEANSYVFGSVNSTTASTASIHAGADVSAGGFHVSPGIAGGALSSGSEYYRSNAVMSGTWRMMGSSNYDTGVGATRIGLFARET